MMKTVTMKKKESMVLEIPVPKHRFPQPPKRGAKFKSVKEYNRKREKRVSY